MRNKIKRTKKEDKPSKARKLAVAFVFILEVFLVFTFFDYILHKQILTYAVPASYFGNWILYGTIIGFFLYLFVRNLKTLKKSLTFSIIMTIILQAYYLLIYSGSFTAALLIADFIIMFLVSYLGFKFMRM